MIHKRYTFISLFTLFFLLVAWNPALSQLSQFEMRSPFRGLDSVSTYKHLIHAYTQSYINSSAITNSFINDAFGRGFIKEPAKQDVIKNLESYNRMGYKLHFGMHYQTSTIFPNTIFNAGWEANEHFHTGFNNHLFELLFKGNKHLAGKQVNLHPFGFTYFSYEKLYAGIQRSIETNALQVSGNLSLIKGSNFQQGQMNKGQMYTSPSGDSISLLTDLQFRTGKEQGTRLTNVNGYGASLDLRIRYTPKNNKNQYLMEIMDLGFIHWHQNEELTAHRKATFTGEDIDNLFTVTDTLFNTMELDSLGALLNTETRSSESLEMLPALFHLRYTRQFYNWFYLTGGLKMMFNAHYIPQLYLVPSFQLPFASAAIQPRVSYGGYGQFDVGLSLYKTFGKRYSFGLTTYYPENFINPSQSMGQGISFYGRIIF